MPIEINGQTADEITANGQTIDEVTANGQVVFQAVDIPDSVVHHYPLLERSNNTIKDVVGNLDAQAQGTTNVSGVFAEGYAEQGSGGDNSNGDVIAWNNGLGGWEQNLVTGGAILITNEADSYDANGRFIGGETSGNSRIRVREIDGVTNYLIRDSDNNEYEAIGQTTIDNNEKHRIVINSPPSSDQNPEIWVDGQKENLDVGSSDNLNTISTFDGFSIHGYWSDFNSAYIAQLNGRHDNFMLTDEYLSESEIQADFDGQPWS